MAMKKIKPQYGKVIPPVVVPLEEPETERAAIVTAVQEVIETIPEAANPEQTATKKAAAPKKSSSKITSVPNPFMQTKEVFQKANLTKIGYRMRSEYVEILDIIKKIKKNGYTLEAVLDDALTFYFENSDDGKEAIKKAELFYS